MSDDYFARERSRQLAYLILSNREDRPLDAAQTAYVFGCDVEALRDAHREHLVESEEWTAAALEARLRADLDEAEACQHEARSWASHANMLRDAAHLCEARALQATDWSLVDEVARYHEASAQRWHVYHMVRERLGVADPEPSCCQKGCCAEDCCGGEECACDDCAAGLAECTVCGQIRVARPVQRDELAAVDADPEVVAARCRERELLEDLYKAFDKEVEGWRRATGVV